MITIPLLRRASVAHPDAGRVGIIDIGSNSIRLVVYDGPARIPSILFNEKVMAGLGRGVAARGAIDGDAIARALVALARFRRLRRARRLPRCRRHRGRSGRRQPGADPRDAGHGRAARVVPAGRAASGGTARAGAARGRRRARPRAGHARLDRRGAGAAILSRRRVVARARPARHVSDRIPAADRPPLPDGAGPPRHPAAHRRPDREEAAARGGGADRIAQVGNARCRRAARLAHAPDRIERGDRLGLRTARGAAPPRPAGGGPRAGSADRRRARGGAPAGPLPRAWRPAGAGRRCRRSCGGARIPSFARSADWRSRSMAIGWASMRAAGR